MKKFKIIKNFQSEQVLRQSSGQVLRQSSGQVLRQSSGQVLRQSSGQAMLILVMVIGSTMLGVSTIAGYISLQKIRTATDIVDSAKSIYAADAGVEWCFYQRKDDPETPCNNEGNQPVMGNDSSVSVNQLGNIVKSIGHSNRSYRAFGIFLDQFN